MTDHVRQLGNTTRGAKPSLLRQAIQGCVFATLLYSAEIWYGPHTSKWAVKQLQYVMNRATRAVLPVYKTTPISVLLRETSSGPAGAGLNRIHDHLALRIAAADSDHPLRRRYHNEPTWNIKTRDAILQEIGAVGCQDGLEVFKQWAQCRNPLDLTVYLDGSMNGSQNKGAGFCIYRGSQKFLHGCIPLGRTVELYDAEVIGALEGFRVVYSYMMGRFATNVAICLDNQEAAIQLRSGQPTLSSFNQIKEFQTLCITWKSRDREIGVQVGTVLVKWIPDHQGILGNERADTLAKQAFDQQTTRTLASISCAENYAQIFYNNASLDFWKSSAVERYKILDIQMTTRISSELHILT
ncbi:hypothetical protein EPUL_006106 [Erysiphe pulchra]|uniref:RNase H type-1 domain-containing protein n=1 Tax=Erysiphe pulchra TaxID=225359 RepID=A0A2S4PK52_9PEZI|nr:hypothetical protein EPUL_006106 [Erysiphe pulchra]